MTRLVVDSSIVIKWSVPEVHSADALRYLDPDLERDAPELLLAEISNILWKKVGRNELTRVQAELTLAPPRFRLPRLGSATRIFRRPPQPGHHNPGVRVDQQHFPEFGKSLIGQILADPVGEPDGFDKRLSRSILKCGIATRSRTPWKVELTPICSRHRFVRSVG
jgi:hypothetical protein